MTQLINLMSYYTSLIHIARQLQFCFCQFNFASQLLQDLFSVDESTPLDVQLCKLHSILQWAYNIIRNYFYHCRFSCDRCLDILLSADVFECVQSSLKTTYVGRCHKSLWSRSNCIQRVKCSAIRSDVFYLTDWGNTVFNSIVRSDCVT